tara:strand:- start:8377 stop:9012 length:636 start_codon:yes stop_codon:yes gene_type:complete
MLLGKFQQTVVINKERYKLKEDSYYQEKHNKGLIIIGNTLNSGMNHYDTWSKKINGKYKKTAMYTVTLNGEIYEHFNPMYYSDYLGTEKFDKKSITIVLENEGWLTKDFEHDFYINWSGEKYEREDKIIEKSWRGRLRWAPYKIKQMDALTFLCDKLIEKFDLDRFVSPNNVKLNEFTKKKGIYYRSNYLKTSLDVSPAFNIKYLKENIEE